MHPVLIEAQQWDWKAILAAGSSLSTGTCRAVEPACKPTADTVEKKKKKNLFISTLIHIPSSQDVFFHLFYQIRHKQNKSFQKYIICSTT